MADTVELQEVGFSNFLWNKWLQFSHLLTFKIECQSLIIIQRNQFLFPFLFLFSSFRFKINNYLQIEFVSDTYWLGFNWKLESGKIKFCLRRLSSSLTWTATAWSPRTSSRSWSRRSQTSFHRIPFINVILGWWQNDWGWGEGSDSPGGQGNQKPVIEARMSPAIDLSQDGNESIDFSEFSKLWAAIKGEGEVGLTKFCSICSEEYFPSYFVVIYLFGTRRTSLHRTAPPFIVSYFPFSIKAAEEMLTTCLRWPGLCQSWNKASLTILLLPHLASSSQSEGSEILEICAKMCSPNKYRISAHLYPEL